MQCACDFNKQVTRFLSNFAKVVRVNYRRERQHFAVSVKQHRIQRVLLNNVSILNPLWMTLQNLVKIHLLCESKWDKVDVLRLNSSVLDWRLD